MSDLKSSLEIEEEVFDLKSFRETEEVYNFDSQGCTFISQLKDGNSKITVYQKEFGIFFVQFHKDKRVIKVNLLSIHRLILFIKEIYGIK